MDFRDSPVEAAFRAEARAFLAAHPPTKMPDYFGSEAGSREGDAAATLALWRSWQQTLHAHGWAAITWPQAYGGRGLGPIEQIIWNQELARTGMGESLFVVGIGMAGPTIIAHGTPEQQAQHLPPMLRGDKIWCQLFSEPGAGSDLASLATRAVRDGDEWIVTGQKTWCSGGHYADHGILLVRSDPKLPKHAGISYLLADMRAPGVSVRPLRQMTGGLHFNEVFLDGVRIPDSQRLGPVGGGWGVAMTTLMNERMAIGGIERWLDFDALVRHAQANRERLDPATRDELARVYTWVRTLELLNAKVITQLGQGKFAAAESAVMKLALARILTKASELGLRLIGPDALARDGFWQNQFLGAPALHIAGGTDEVQKNVAAERVLGLPREPRRDKDVAFEDLPRS
jgi:alkylation response protein AidB-like acyl-CoA dehydrogenase